MRPTGHTAEHTSPRVGMEFDLENPLTSCEDEQQRRDSISDLFAAESDHMIFTVGTIDLHARRNAVSLILQVKLYIEREKAIFFFSLSPLSIPLFHCGVHLRGQAQFDSEKSWILRLLSVSCLSLASKMRKTSFALADIQKLLDCSSAMGDAEAAATDGCDDLAAMEMASSSLTPVTVLSHHCSSFESEAAAGSSSDVRELKKRRISALHASCDHNG
ncbi:hypothetical protein BHM03_00037391 [Ensete ventricosum]|nr:hypothetical protein BHM03_00037391 [Ensete ventricosum]